MGRKTILPSEEIAPKGEYVLKRGDIIVAGDQDLRDMYMCRVMQNEVHIRNPLVTVLYPIRYPIQHAIIDPGVANENPPIGEGETCRLTFIGRAKEGDIINRSYETELARCLAVYESNRLFIYGANRRNPTGERQVRSPSAEELEIIARHKKREYNTHRVLIRH